MAEPELLPPEERSGISAAQAAQAISEDDAAGDEKARAAVAAMRPTTGTGKAAKKKSDVEVVAPEEAPEQDEEEAFDELDMDEEETDDTDDGGEIEPLPALTAKATPAAAVRDPLALYLREVGRFPMLKPDEEFELAQRVREHGDSEAAFRLVSSHLRLVVKIAMDFQRRWMQNVLDLIQEGNVGLMRAVQKFDPDKGIKFSYYAAFWIKAYILKFIMDNWRMVKIGTTQAQRKLFYNLSKERQRLQSLGFDADSKTISENLGVTKEEVEEMEIRLGSGDMSLDVPLSDDSSSTRMDFLPAVNPSIEETLATEQMTELLLEHIRQIQDDLNEKERDILNQRLLSEDPVTLREIGEKYGITRERVRQLETRLLKKIRERMEEEIADFSRDWITNKE